MSDYPGTQPDAPATNPQYGLIRHLARNLNVKAEDEAANVLPEGTDFQSITRQQASQIIDHLKSLLGED